MSFGSITGVTNATFWDLARKASPTFKSHTAKGTADLFTEKGFQSITRTGLGIINEFFELSIRVAFQKVDISRAKNPLASSGLVQVYDTPNGGIVQRIAVNSIKPVTPAYRGLEDGDSIDPFIVRKPDTSERFWENNFDFQNLITLQPFQVKQIFLSEYGMGEYIAGILQGMENAFIIQEYENTLEALNAALNSSVYPLQDTQKIVLDAWGSGTDGEVTDDDLKGLILRLQILKEAMGAVSQTSAYNAGGFATVVDDDDYVLLVRAGIQSMMNVETLAGAFNQDRLFIPWKIQSVTDFGGLRPYMLDDTDPDAPVEVAQQPVYDRLGVVVGYIDADVTVNGPATRRGDGQYIVSVTSGGVTADTLINAEPDGWSDPNADIIAVVAQKGVVFENRQNPYIVETIRNPRGMYDNYFANSPNNSVVYDHFYNLIAISKPTA